MDYKFTFEDGSEAYLAHYGVKGMKWKDHVARPEDKEKKRRRARKLQNIQKSLGEAASGSAAKKAKARTKAHFAKKKKRGSGGRKDLSGRSILIEDAGGGKTKTSYY
jgi:hypothetical protein